MHCIPKLAEILIPMLAFVTVQSSEPMVQDYALKPKDYIPLQFLPVFHMFTSKLRFKGMVSDQSKFWFSM